MPEPRVIVDIDEERRKQTASRINGYTKDIASAAERLTYLRNAAQSETDPERLTTIGVEAEVAEGRIVEYVGERKRLRVGNVDPAKAYNERIFSFERARNLVTRTVNNPYFVEGLIPKTGCFIVFGNPGSCKSWGILDACLRSFCETPAYFMGIEGARVHPARNILWCFGNEDLGSDLVEVTTDDEGVEAEHALSLVTARIDELLRREEQPFDLDLETGDGLHSLYVKTADDLTTTIRQAAKSPQPPQVVVVDTITSICPEVLDMKGGEASQFYGGFNALAIELGILILVVAHPKKASKDARNGHDPLDKDNLLGSSTIPAVVAGILAIHAAAPEDVDPDGAGIRVKLAKRNKRTKTGQAEARVHWDAENHTFLQGDTPQATRQDRAHFSRMAYLTAIAQATDYSTTATARNADLSCPIGWLDEDDEPYWPKNATAAKAYRNWLHAHGFAVKIVNGSRCTSIQITAAGIQLLEEFDRQDGSTETPDIDGLVRAH